MRAPRVWANSTALVQISVERSVPSIGTSRWRYIVTPGSWANRVVARTRFGRASNCRHLSENCLRLSFVGGDLRPILVPPEGPDPPLRKGGRLASALL